MILKWQNRLSQLFQVQYIEQQQINRDRPNEKCL